MKLNLHLMNLKLEGWPLFSSHLQLSFLDPSVFVRKENSPFFQAEVKRKWLLPAFTEEQANMKEKTLPFAQAENSKQKLLPVFICTKERVSICYTALFLRNRIIMNV